MHDHIYVTRNLFTNARRYFSLTNAFVDLTFDPRPDIFHCTYQLPLWSKSACNVYTIHDLVPLRLPFTTLDNKRWMFRLLKKIAAKADHIVTVSENTKRDIIELLGVDEKRITNTYQAVSFPKEDVERSEDAIAEQLAGSFGLESNEYLLFFGALEPKKNVGRLIEAYLASGVDIPLVLVAGEGWHNESETTLLEELRENEPGPTGNRTRLRRRVRRFRYVRPSTLITLIRGARAVVFPSLYEGFGLPVLEAMTLGTPVVTSRESSLPEIAGDAALLVDPYDADDIARAITTIVNDADLRAELSRRGRLQAAKFSRRALSRTRRGALRLAALNVAAGRDEGSRARPFQLWPRPVRVGHARMRFPAIGASCWTKSAGRYSSSFNRVVQMSETSQLHRVRSLARAVAADVGIHPRAGAADPSVFPIA